MFPWMGGKGRLVKDILPMFPPHDCYVEAFCGGGALFFAKDPSQVEVINDINGDIVNLFRVVQNHLEELVRHFKWALTSRQIYEWEKITRPETLTDVQRAARFLYLQRLSFGGRVVSPNFGTSTTDKPKLNLLRIEENLSAAHLRLSEVTIEQGSWIDVVTRYDREHTLFYLDPPYYDTAGYGVAFPDDEYGKIAASGNDILGKMVISLNDHPFVRECFAGYVMEQLETTYSVGGAKAQKRVGELLIFNAAAAASRPQKSLFDEHTS